ncbi:MAG: menaquinone biosynthesis protein, partial [Planctomycetes bacterium]|nr:menaquinone biosynthesis protein [Planctomycetota bacterium]
MPGSVSRLVRIGAVSYLNSKPLIEDLQELAENAELILDYPSRLAEDLAAGTLDVALVPSIECLFHPEYRIVSDACVATRGPVLSVKLFSRVELGEIRSMALDEGSRTSSMLVRIMLSERYGVEPTLEPLPLGCSSKDTTADAILLIGDRAIHPPEEQFMVTWDLGEQWTHWTGLPFVFALWAARQGCDLSGVEEALSRARDRGLENIDQIARREAAILGMPEQT